jgi:hypothetical protein
MSASFVFFSFSFLVAFLQCGCYSARHAATTTSPPCTPTLWLPVNPQRRQHTPCVHVQRRLPTPPLVLVIAHRIPTRPPRRQFPHTACMLCKTVMGPTPQTTNSPHWTQSVRVRHSLAMQNALAHRAKRPGSVLSPDRFTPETRLFAGVANPTSTLCPNLAPSSIALIPYLCQLV